MSKNMVKMNFQNGSLPLPKLFLKLVVSDCWSWGESDFFKHMIGQNGEIKCHQICQKGLPHTSNFHTLTIHNFPSEWAIELKFDLK